jgi:hypothetical protein
VRDDLHRALSAGRRTWRRRKRSVIGKEWTPPGLQDVTAGVWCKRCHIRHPYNGKDKLGISYDRRDEGIVILWLCPISGDVVKEGTE